MKKPRLLYASPFPPQKSGISDYSVVLVKALSRFFDITLYTDNYEISEKSLFGYVVLKHGVDSIPFDDFDYILYNMGNNAEFHSYIYEAALAHPGVVILHDFVLYHFISGYYSKNLYSTIYNMCGIDELCKIKAATKEGRRNDVLVAADMPLNDELLASGNGFLVHSMYAYNQAVSRRKDLRINKINMIMQMEEGHGSIDRKELYEKYGIPEKSTLICSYGNIIATKKIRETCTVVSKLIHSKNRNICYVMVGAGSLADDLLVDGKIIKTGYCSLEEFDSFVEYADITINLRTPSMGETSAALLRILQAGKACIINGGGWFSEIPEECVYRIDIDDVEKKIENALCNLLDNDEMRIQMCENAKKYIEKEYRTEVIIEQIKNFITEDEKRREY